MYHWQNGWYFERLENGEVHIFKKTEPDVPVIPQMYIPANEWASIVASVSKDGENSSTYTAAENLHSGLTKGVADKG